MRPGTFLSGALLHPALQEVVIGRVCAGQPAVLPAQGRIRVQVGGVLIEDLTPDEAARIDFHCLACFNAAPAVIEVDTPQRRVAARVHLSDAAPPDAPADVALAVAAAAEVMARFGRRPAEAVAARYPQILVRAAARLRAGAAAQVPLARRPAPGDVQVSRWCQPYAQFFALEEIDLEFRRFDGTMSWSVRREVFVSGDAAAVLPYDPARDRVLVIEQFRAGPFARGDAQPWLVEPVAGRVDPGETPQQAVRREAQEEAGLTLGALMQAAEFYPTPAAKSEYLYAFLGLADLPDGWCAGATGKIEEHEDIRAHVLSFDRLMALVDAGQIRNGPLVLLALFLARRRDALRGALEFAPPPA